jgi:hypothetical protein
LKFQLAIVETYGLFRSAVFDVNYRVMGSLKLGDNNAESLGT